MSSYNFEKYIILPSGGLEYSPFVSVMPLTNATMLYDLDLSYHDSKIENILSLMKHCAKLSFDILEMFYDDFLYLWFHILMLDIQKTSEITEIHNCAKCGNLNSVLIDISDLNLKIINPNDVTIKKFYEFNINNIYIKFRLRKLKDILLFSILQHSLDIDEKNQCEYCIIYMAPQIEELRYNDEIIPKEEIIQFLTFRHLSEIFSIYDKIFKVNNLFGIDRKIKFKCKKCDHENATLIYNDMIYGYISSTSNNNVYRKQFNFIKYLLNMSSMQSITLKEFFDLPLRFNDQLFDVFQISKIQQGGVFTVYNDGLK